MIIVVFDTAFGSGNLGDQIIMQSVDSEVDTLFPQAFIFRVPTHSKIGRYGRSLLKKADYIFAGGTNLLFSHWSKQRQWRLEFADLIAANRKVVLMGTGWTDYQSPPDWKARYAYTKMLSRENLHSLRDAYSLDHLKSIGFRHLANTGCPTLWNLPDLKPVFGAGERFTTIVTTLTDYRKEPQQDRAMLLALVERCKDVRIWLQGSGDGDYFRELDVGGIIPINPSLKAYDAVLERDRAVTFVGTRLHAGIRALQKRRRALIISVDNRAREMAKDFDLPIVERGDLSTLKEHLDNWPSCAIRLPHEHIAAWRDQFSTVPGNHA